MEEIPSYLSRDNPTTGLTLLWARNPFRGNSSHWQLSQEEARWFIPERWQGNEKDISLILVLLNITLSKTNERRVSLFERKVLRCIFGAKQEDGTLQKRCNCELYEIFNEPNIVNYIKVKRLA